MEYKKNDSLRTVFDWIPSREKTTWQTQKIMVGWSKGRSERTR